MLLIVMFLLLFLVLVLCLILSFFFCKQKTAYEMRISDWSSDVCSSDLQLHAHHHRAVDPAPRARAPADAAEPGARRLKFVPLAVRDGAGDQRSEPRRDHPLWRGTDRHRHRGVALGRCAPRLYDEADAQDRPDDVRSEEHTSELQSLMR